MQKCDKKDVEDRRSNFKQILQSLKFKIILPKNNATKQKIKPQNHAFPNRITSSWSLFSSSMVLVVRVHFQDQAAIFVVLHWIRWSKSRLKHNLYEFSGMPGTYFHTCSKCFTSRIPFPVAYQSNILTFHKKHPSEKTHV